MIPFWFLRMQSLRQYLYPEAVERVPLTMRRAFELLDQSPPPGVVNLLKGESGCGRPYRPSQSARSQLCRLDPGSEICLCESRRERQTAQCQGRRQKHVIVLPDADWLWPQQIIGDSAFGCAGQRCLAVSVAVTVGEAQTSFRDAITMPQLPCGWQWFG